MAAAQVGSSRASAGRCSASSSRAWATVAPSGSSSSSSVVFAASRNDAKYRIRTCMWPLPFCEERSSAVYRAARRLRQRLFAFAASGLRDQFSEEAHAIASRAALALSVARAAHGGVGDIEVRPGRLADELTQHFCGGD